MGNKTAKSIRNNRCLGPVVSIVPGGALESALFRQDFDEMKRILTSAVDSSVESRVVGCVASHQVKVDRFFGDETLLQLAVKFQRVDIVQLLLQLGANPDRCAKSALTPLSRAIILNNEEIFNALLQHGCDPNLASDDGVTPLLYAVIVNRPFALAAMLAHPHVDKNQIDSSGMTALHHACRHRFIASTNFVQQLLQVGVRVDVYNVNGSSPLHLAVECPQKTALIVDHIAERNCDKNNTNKSLGLPSSYSSCLNDYLQVRDRNGLTALHCALLKESPESALILVTAGAHFGVIPQNFAEQVLTAVIVSNQPALLRHLLLSLPDPTCCFFASSVSPPAGLFDMAFTLRRFEVAERLRGAACLPRSRRPRSIRISANVANGFNSPCRLQSYARLAIRRLVTTNDAKRYISVISKLDLPDELIRFLLFDDVEFGYFDQNLPSAASLQMPDIARVGITVF